jgi:hypothetical protein
VLREQQLDKRPRLCHRPPQGRRRARLAQAGLGQDQVNGRDQEVYFARPTLRLVINQPFDVTDRAASMTSSRRSRAAACRARPARSARHRPGADPLRAGAAHDGQARRLPDPRQPRRRAQEVRPRQGPPQLPVLEALAVNMTDMTADDASTAAAEAAARRPPRG